MRISAFLSGFATKTNGPFWPLWIATVGIITVFGRTERSISTSTYMPGQSSNFSLANFALAAMVPGRGVDQAVDEVEFARGERLAGARAEDAHHRRRLGDVGLAKRGEIALGQREGDADRPDLRDRHQAGGIVHADEVARRHADGAEPAADRRLDLGVVELQIVGAELRLVGLDDRQRDLVVGCRLIELLARRRRSVSDKRW